MSAGNKTADLLARQGIEKAKDLTYSTPYVPVHPRQIKKAIRHRMVDVWQRRWDLMESCTVSHLFKPIVGIGNKVKKLGFQEMNRLSQIITGHGLFNIIIPVTKMSTSSALE